MSLSNQRRFTPSAQANGFTLIELIVVIVILGILSATALPKFINLGQDARLKVLTATKTTIITASHQAFAMCQLQPICNASQNQSNQFEGPNGLVGTLFKGYPTGLSRVPHYFGIKDWVVVGGNISVTEVSPTTTDFIVNDAPTPADCKIRYRESASFGAFPTITEFASGC